MTRSSPGAIADGYEYVLMRRRLKATNPRHSRNRRLPLVQAITIVVLAAALTAVVLTLAVGNQSSPKSRQVASSARTPTRSKATVPANADSAPTSAVTTTTSAASTPAPTPPHPVHRSYAVGVETLRMTDRSRTIETASGPVARSFEVIVRYPVAMGAGQPAGPFPLIVFGHGYAVTPEPYTPLLEAWTKAGFVVAAPVFPLENANAPGGPNEQDLPNQPRDMSLVISSMIATSEQSPGPLAGVVNPRQVAVSGQSDGGDTALAAAYDPAVRDPRIGAAMILSGAEDPFVRRFAMPASGPPLLAVQGTADTINPPQDTNQFYSQAAAPKSLLQLIGASHQPPYTERGPELDAVVRTTVAFLDAVFKGRPGRFRALQAAGNAGPSTTLVGSGL
jgi:dienelactone hydrolase